MKYYIIFIIMIISTGCVNSSKNTIISSSMLELDSSVKKSDYKGDIPSSVAILPFYAKNKEASLIVTNSFYSYFSMLPYNDVELSTIREKYKDSFTINIPQNKLNNICKELNVNGLIYGDVKNFDKLYLGLYSEVSAGAKLSFYNCNTKKNIWSFEDTAKKREGGVSVTPWGMVMTAIVSAYNLRKVQVYRASEDLFRDAVKSIPHSKYNIKDTIKPPSFIYHSGMKKDIFGIGDKITIKVSASKNLKITANITSISQTIVLKELKDGIYSGSYTVKPSDNTNGYLKLNITSNTARGTFYEYISKINIDTTAPIKADITTTYADKIFLNIDSNEEIKEYILEKLVNNEFVVFLKSKTNEFILPITNESIIVRVRLKDKANNISIPSDTIKVFLYKDKNIASSSIYQNDTIISNTIRIEKDLTLDKLYVAKDGYLIIMPNTKIDIKVLKIDGMINILNSNIKVKRFIVNGNLKLSNSIISSNTYGVELKNSSKAYIENSIIKSKYSSLKIIDAAYAEVENTTLKSNDVFSDVIISGNGSSKIVNCIFDTKNIADVVSNSSKKSIVIGDAIVQGAVNVKK